MEEKNKIGMIFFVLGMYAVGVILGASVTYFGINHELKECKVDLDYCVDKYNTDCVGNPMMPIMQPLNITFGVDKDGSLP